MTLPGEGQFITVKGDRERVVCHVVHVGERHLVLAALVSSGALERNGVSLPAHGARCSDGGPHVLTPCSSSS